MSHPVHSSTTIQNATAFNASLNLHDIAESDEANDLEQQQATPRQTPHQHARRLITPSSNQRRGSAAAMARRYSSAGRRQSTGMGRRTSISDHSDHTLNETMNHEDASPANYRDYLRAQRNLKHSFRVPLPAIDGDAENNDTSADTMQHQRGSSAAEAAAAVADMESIASNSERDMASDFYDFGPARVELNSAKDSKEEEKRRRRERKREEAYRRNVHNLACAGRRGSIMTGDNLLWETLLDTEEDMEYEEEYMEKEAQHNMHSTGSEDEVVDADQQLHVHQTPGTIPWYTPPMQRVFYGKPQILPHVNWGDLFFDLFFVAAAYNLGALLVSSMNDNDWLRGLMYFIGIFGALYQTWYHDLTFSSRYTVLDQVHHLIWGLKFFTVGVAIIFITPLNLMGDPKSIEMLSCIFALLVETLINFGLNVEIYFKAIGDRTPIKKHARRMILNEDLPYLFFYLVALVLAILAYAGVDVYGNESTGGDAYGGDVRDRLLATASDVECSSGGRLLLSRMLGASGVECPSEGYRKLAGATDDGCTCHTGINFSTDDIPMAIVYFAYCFNTIFSFFRQLSLTSKEKDIRDRFVPNNLDYVIHRYGEWIMLMIGEGVLSLLIVETTESVEYFAVSCFGVLTVMGIHLLVFESQPSTSEGHAIYRSLRAQLIFNILVQYLSLGLIAFGVCFKIMLTTIVSNQAKLDAYESRRLAGAISVSEEATAALFSASLAIVLISLEFMLATHKGAKGTYKRLFKSRNLGEKGIVKHLNKSLILLVLFKICLIVFTATLSQWQRSLTEVSIISFTIVVAMSISRIVAWGLVHREDEIRRMFKSIKSAPRNLKRTVSNEMLNLLSRKSSASGSGSFSFETPLEEESAPLEESDELGAHKEVWDTSYESIIVVCRGGSLRYINQTALNELRYSESSEILGNKVSMLFGGTQDEDDPLELQKLGPSSRPPKMLGQYQDGKEPTLHAKRKDGTMFPCMIGLKSLPGTDFISGFIRDASNLAALENSTKEGFITAASRGDETEIRRMLLESNTHLNEGDYDNRTALHLACENGHSTVALVLCEARADVNAQDRFGNQPLDNAVAKHHAKCIQILTRFGARRGKHSSLQELMDAASRGDSYEIKILLDEGDINVNESDADGRTALHVAVAGGFESVVQVLCDAGANVNVLDGGKKRPMDLVDEQKHWQVKTILQEHGAQSSSKMSSKSSKSEDDIFEDAFDAIIITDFDGIIRNVNNTALELFAYRKKQSLLGKGIPIVCPDLGPDSDVQAITKARRESGDEFLCMVVSKQNERTKLVTRWIRDMSAFDQQLTMNRTRTDSNDTNDTLGMMST